MKNEGSSGSPKEKTTEKTATATKENEKLSKCNKQLFHENGLGLKKRTAVLTNVHFG